MSQRILAVGRGPVGVRRATLVAPAQIWQASATPKQSTQYGLAGAPRNIAALAGCGCSAAAQGHGPIAQSQDSSPTPICGLDRGFRAQFCPAAPLWLHCASHNRAISLGQHKHGYQAGAAPFTLANNTEHICAQVRPLSATCGIHQIGGFRALGRRSLRWTPEQRRQQPKTTDYQHSLPRHDPGHRAGGAAPKGPPQAAIAMMMRSALADGFAATLPT